MNIDNLLNLNEPVHAHTAGGSPVPGEVVEIIGEDLFVFSPKVRLAVDQGTLMRITDGRDSIIAKVVEQGPAGIRMTVECYASPGNERRQDVRIYDKVYFKARFLCSDEKKLETIPDAVERIQGGKRIIDSFLKGGYGFAGNDEEPRTREASSDDRMLWEVNRKLDLLIHMSLDAGFMELMKTTPKDVNISASGIRFISHEPFGEGDLLEIAMILPMVPLMFIRLIGDVIRRKTVTSYEKERYAIALRFLRVDPDTKEDIIRYLFRRQREVLRKRHI